MPPASASPTAAAAAAAGAGGEAKLSRKRSRLRRRSCRVNGTPAAARLQSGSGSENSHNSRSRSLVNGSDVSNDVSDLMSLEGCEEEGEGERSPERERDPFLGGDKRLTEAFGRIVAEGKKFLEWDYSVERFRELVAPIKPLPGMVLCVLYHSGFVRAKEDDLSSSSGSGSNSEVSEEGRILLDPQRVNYWAEKVDQLYNNGLPFHNSLHALDTLQAVHCIIQTPAIKDSISDEHILAICNQYHHL